MKYSVKSETLSQFVGSYLKEEIKRRGMTQEVFADRIGMSERNLRRWLRGQRLLLDQLEEVSRALHIPITPAIQRWEELHAFEGSDSSSVKIRRLTAYLPCCSYAGNLRLQRFMTSSQPAPLPAAV